MRIIDESRLVKSPMMKIEHSFEEIEERLKNIDSMPEGCDKEVATNEAIDEYSLRYSLETIWYAEDGSVDNGFLIREDYFPHLLTILGNMASEIDMESLCFILYKNATWVVYFIK